MNENGAAGPAGKAARILSLIFHPVMIPVFGMVIILTAPTLYSFIPFEVKKLIILIILVNNVLLPLSLIPFLVHRNYISSWDLSGAKDRNIVLVLATFLYIITSYIHVKFPIPAFIKVYFLSITFLSLAVTIINRFWQISLHSVSAGAMFALVIVLSVRMYTSLTWFLIPVILVGGLIMAARLKLGKNDSLQVWAGYFTGFTGFILAASLFQKFF